MADGDGVINTAYTFEEGDSVTPARLNNITDTSTFTANAIEGTTLALSGGKLKVGAITSSEIGASAVLTAGINDGAVTTDKLADLGTTTAKINDEAVTTAKINDDAVTTAKIDAPTQAEMEAEADKVAAVNLLKYHPGIAKAWGVIENLDTTPTLRTGSYNVSGVAVNGDDSEYFDVTLSNAMDSTNYIVTAAFQHNSANLSYAVEVDPTSASQFTVGSNENFEDSAIHFVIYGNLA